MASHDITFVITGSVIEENSLSLAELCRACGTHADWIINLVEEAIIEPQGEDLTCWRFSGESIVRVRSALRLQRDLGLNLAGIGLVLELRRELEALRHQVELKNSGLS